MMSEVHSAERAVCVVAARVASIKLPCRAHVQIEVVPPMFPPSQPGQFAQLLCRTGDDRPVAAHEWPSDDFPSLTAENLTCEEAYLRRPFSIADRWSAPDGSVHLLFISRAVGPGTRWLSGLRVGDRLDITGPLGRGYRVPAADRPVVLMGGGVGIPPLLYLARRLHERKHRHVTAILGATTRDLLPLHLLAPPHVDGTATPCVAWPAGASFSAIIATDDGSVGLAGTTVDGLLAWQRGRGVERREATVFACGPDGMLRAVAQATRALDLDCQLCIERPMGCGLGTCLSCIVRTRDESRPEGWSWGLACRDGPVFDRDDLLDYQHPQRA